MAGLLSYLRYNDESLYIVDGFIKETEDSYNYIISMKYDNFRYEHTVNVNKFDETDLEMSRLFIKFFIKNLKKLINNEIEYMKLDGESNMNTTFCRIYHKDEQYFITHVNDKIDNWIIKFDNNYGIKLLNVLENLLNALQNIKYFSREKNI